MPLSLLPAHPPLVAALHVVITRQYNTGAVSGNLQHSLSRRPDRAQFYGVLGSLYAWQGAEAEALAALERRVALDGPQALDDYAPFELWRRQLLNEAAPEPWNSTFHLYSQWSTRFPDRAESVVLRALVGGQQQGNVEQAAGLDQDAEPQALLRYALEAVR